MKLKPFIPPNEQYSKIGRYSWSVARLFTLAKNLQVMEIPLDHLNVWNIYEKLTIRELAGHVKAVNDADLRYPIILDEDGEIMDGRHRIMKAMVLGKKTIKAVRFETNPSPCQVSDDKGG